MITPSLRKTTYLAIRDCRCLFGFRFFICFLVLRKADLKPSLEYIFFSPNIKTQLFDKLTSQFIIISPKSTLRLKWHHLPLQQHIHHVIIAPNMLKNPTGTPTPIAILSLVLRPLPLPLPPLLLPPPPLSGFAVVSGPEPPAPGVDIVGPVGAAAGPTGNVEPALLPA